MKPRTSALVISFTAGFCFECGSALGWAFGLERRSGFEQDLRRAGTGGIALSALRRFQRRIGPGEQAGETVRPGVLAFRGGDQVLADFDLDVRQAALFAMGRDAVVAVRRSSRTGHCRRRPARLPGRSRSSRIRASLGSLLYSMPTCIARLSPLNDGVKLCIATSTVRRRCAASSNVRMRSW